jgi:hypothetical protein
MTGLESITLLIVIFAASIAIGAYLTKGQRSLTEITKDFYNNQEVQEVNEPEVDILNIEVISEEIKAVNVEGEKPKKKENTTLRKNNT